MFRSGRAQIPLDLVVKYQAVDIAEVMFYRSGAGPSSTHHVATGNRGVSRSHHCKITGLPLNLGECGQSLKGVVSMPSSPQVNDKNVSKRFAKSCRSFVEFP